MTNKWIHVISLDSKRSSGSFKSKTFQSRFSKNAIQWFNKEVDKVAIGHLTQYKDHRPHIEIGVAEPKYYKGMYEDSVGNLFMMWAYKHL